MSGMLWDVRSALEPVLRSPSVIGITLLAAVLGVGAMSEMVTVADGVVRRQCGSGEAARRARLERVLDRNDVRAAGHAEPGVADDLRKE
jgi:hypothetical protein